MPDDAGPSARARDWLTSFRRACDAIADESRRLAPSERRRDMGPGAGGDRTVLIDRVAEDVVVAELEALAGDGGLTLVSEEIGRREIGSGGGPVVVVDPIDGSLNAKRGLPYFATSLAVADGETMGDVWLGLVRDHATGEEFVGELGRGAWLDGRPLAALEPDGDLRIVVVEGAYPHRIHAAAIELQGVRRLRMIGSLAISLCQVAAGRCDGMAGLGGGRAVDVAAGQLIARELGATVGLPGVGDLAGAPLDVTTQRHLVAAANPEHVPQLMRAVRAARGSDG
jgi:myo-inositol-1(or 4)-monophosphatase